MTNFAKVIDDVVTDVIVADEDIIGTFRQDGSEWIESSPARANDPGIGFKYDRDNDVFYPPSPGEGWTISAPDWTWHPPAETPEQIKARLSAAVQKMLDEKVKERNYDGILSACSYATSTNPKFAAEGQACVAWRDAVWDDCYVLLDRVTNGQMAVPTADELIAMLPKLEWPAV